MKSYVGIDTPTMFRTWSVMETIISVVGLVVTAGMSVLLIPPYGASGAAIASTIGYMAGGLVAWATFIRLERREVP